MSVHTTAVTSHRLALANSTTTPSITTSPTNTDAFSSTVIRCHTNTARRSSLLRTNRVRRRQSLNRVNRRTPIPWRSRRPPLLLGQQLLMLLHLLLLLLPLLLLLQLHLHERLELLRQNIHRGRRSRNREVLPSRLRLELVVLLNRAMHILEHQPFTRLRYITSRARIQSSQQSLVP